MFSIPVTNNILQDVQRGNSPNSGENGADIDGTADFPNHPQSAALSVGVEKERVDPYTLEIIEHLFPGHHGLEFLAAILRLAMAKQIVLPELGLSEAADVAVITVQSLRVLARLIGLSYETTEKYVVLFCRLRLLYKKRYRRQIVLYFPLSRCHLPEPQALDALDYRSSVQSFASQVKRRFVLLRKKSTAVTPDPSPAAHQVNAQPLSHLLISDISRILQQEVDSEIAGRLLLKIEGAVRYRCTQENLLVSGEGVTSSPQESGLSQNLDSEVGRTGSENGLFPLKVDSIENDGTLREKESIFSRQNLDSEVGTAPTEETHLEKKSNSHLSEVDSEIHQESGLSQNLDSEVGRAGSENGLFPSKMDSLEGNGAFQGKESTFSAKNLDSDATATASLNDNVIIYSNNNINKDDNVNDDPTTDRYTPREAGKVGQQLASFLEKSPANIGGFVNKVKRCSRTVVQAAVIDTLVHTAFPKIDPADERGRPKSKGGWFHGACNRYAQPGTPIPAYVLRWVKTGLSWEEIERDLNAEAMAYQSYMVAGGPTADLVRGYLRGEIDKQGLDQALQQAVKPEVVTGATGSVRPTRMIEWKGRMVPEEQAYREGYYGGFERFKPSDHPLDDLAARVKYYQSIGKLPTFPQTHESEGERQ